MFIRSAGKFATECVFSKEFVSMNTENSPALTVYNPNKVLDAIIEKLDLKNDAALSRALEVAPPVISKIRHCTLPIGATILLRMHEISDFSIRELREFIATPANQESAAA